MKFTALLDLALALADNAAEAKRVTMALCRKDNFADCTVLQDVRKKRCTDVPDRLNDKIQSITFQGSDSCTFYVDAECAGNNFSDSGDVPDIKKKFNKKISSFMCA